jgi:chaperonin GroES
MMKQQIKPLGDRVLLKRVEALEKTKSGIFLPDTAKEKPEQGTVIAVGSEAKELKKGDTVLFSKYSPTEVKIDNEDFLIVKEEDILAII